MMRSVDVAIIGAGPYGLSLAAHLRSRDIDAPVFGEPMGAWKNNMPAGMLLKSYPWASNLSDAESAFTAKRFYTERGLPYDDALIALPRETFISYGEAFQARFVPFVENKMLVSLKPVAAGFEARFDDDETIWARRVVVAIGMSAFKYTPPFASHLPHELISHSGDYGPLDSLDGKRVVVVGSGSSATDLCALLHERGTSVSLVARASKLVFAGTPRLRSAFERATAPDSGIGEGWTMGVCATTPWVVNRMPANIRIRLADTKALGPLGGAFMRDRVIGKFPQLLGRTLSEITRRGDTVEMRLTAADGLTDTVHADHVIFATGYKTDVSRLSFLDRSVTSRVRLTGTAPLLSHHYESSIPGLHLIGPASAYSFGPVCRFVFGTFHPARHLTRLFTKPAPRVQMARSPISAVPQQGS
jgi:cation diffusion facilitator CzcD-associated flavoprotein CzcO